MRIKIIAAVISCLFSIKCTSQVKFPVHIYGSKELSFNKGFDDVYVFQFFIDSTFKMTRYKSLKHHLVKSEIKGTYLKHGDTLLLNDSGSKYFPFVKQPNDSAAFAKDKIMQLFPAKIIMQDNEAIYTSYLQISHKLYSSFYGTIVEFEREFIRKKKYYENTRNIQF